MNSIRKFLRFLVYGNFYVSFAAGLLALETKLVFNIPLISIIDSYGENNNIFLVNDFHFWMVFCLTFSAYNFQRLVKVKDKESAGFKQSERGLFFQKNFFLFATLSSLSVLWVVLELSKVSKLGILLLGFCGLISLLYVKGFMRLAMPSLRSLPYFKIFLIAIVWTLICGLFPVIGNDQIQDCLIYYLIAFGAFIFAVTIPFDIRDVDVDKANNVITFPVKLGEERSRRLSYFALMIYTVFVLLLFLQESIGYGHAFVLVLSAIISAIIISFSKKERPEFFFSVLVEGIMLLQFFLVLIADYIFW